MEYKFLSDGRKVAVLGAINSKEYIVQEIYVTDDGDEFPAGEKFTTKNLLDKPAQTYLESEKKRWQEKINKLKIEYSCKGGE